MSKRKRRRVHRRTDKLSYGIYHGETSVLMSASKRRFSKVRHPKCLAYPKKKAVVLGPLVVIQTLVQGRYPPSAEVEFSRKIFSGNSWQCSLGDFTASRIPLPSPIMFNMTWHFNNIVIMTTVL